MYLRKAVVGLVLTLVAGRADAGPLPASWSYRNPLNEIAFADGASGGLTFPNTVFQSVTGDGEIVATKVASYSIAAAANPDRVTSLPYHFEMELRDDKSGEVARLFFEGLLTGDLWRTGTTLSNQSSSQSVQSLGLGDNLYTVTVGRFTAPSGYGDEAAGAITTQVSVTGLVGPPPESTDVPTPPSPSINTPEPTTVALVLAGLPVAWVLRSSRRHGS